MVETGPRGRASRDQLHQTTTHLREEIQRLYDLAQEPKRFLEIRGDHNEGFMVSWDKYKKGVGEFLNTVLGERSSSERQGPGEAQ